MTNDTASYISGVVYGKFGTHYGWDVEMTTKKKKLKDGTITPALYTLSITDLTDKRVFALSDETDLEGSNIVTMGRDSVRALFKTVKEV